jgi:hypothetical protein
MAAYLSLVIMSGGLSNRTDQMLGDSPKSRPTFQWFTGHCKCKARIASSAEVSLDLRPSPASRTGLTILSVSQVRARVRSLWRASSANWARRGQRRTKDLQDGIVRTIKGAI